ncbi:MAG TPA: hypothetical protein VLC71_05585 [Thermomonas sp.]|nr:hypothetical protein [Thermomonas sp.]
MRLLLASLLLAVGLLPNTSRADGFGWYVCSVEWRDLMEDVEGLRVEATGLLASANTRALRAHLQLNIDSAIVNHCHERGADQSPAATSFYAIDTVEYALSAQQAHGVNDSFFRFFAQPPEVVGIDPGRTRPLIDPYYFVLSPEQVEAFQRELVALNEREHPDDMARMQLKHMQAMMLMTMHDHWGETSSKAAGEYGNGRRGLIFYGHD